MYILHSHNFHRNDRKFINTNLSAFILWVTQKSIFHRYIKYVYPFRSSLTHTRKTLSPDAWTLKAKTLRGVTSAVQGQLAEELKLTITSPLSPYTSKRPVALAVSVKSDSAEKCTVKFNILNVTCLHYYTPPVMNRDCSSAEKQVSTSSSHPLSQSMTWLHLSIVRIHCPEPLPHRM